MNPTPEFQEATEIMLSNPLPPNAKQRLVELKPFIRPDEYIHFQDFLEHVMPELTNEVSPSVPKDI